MTNKNKSEEKKIETKEEKKEVKEVKQSKLYAGFKYTLVSSLVIAYFYYSLIKPVYFPTFEEGKPIYENKIGEEQPFSLEVFTIN